MSDRLSIIKKNIARRLGRAADSAECLIPHLDMLAEYICDSISQGDPSDIWSDSLLRSYTSVSDSLLGDTEGSAAPDFAKRAARVLRAAKDSAGSPPSIKKSSPLLWSRPLLCKMIAEKLVQTGRLRSTDELWRINGSNIDDNGSDRIIYVRNPYSNSAYSEFASRLREPSAVYCDDFISACEAVYDGEADFCILPTESSADGRLAGFSRLITKYELKTSAVCEIPTDEDGAFTGFSLVSKALRTGLERKEPLELSFTLTATERYSLKNILFFAEFFGLELRRIDFLPVSYSQSESSYLVTLRVPSFGIDSGFLLCLALEAPGAVITGFYPQIKDKNR